MRILDELKTERAQAEVDDRRATAEFADAVEGDAFDASKAENAGERRVQAPRGCAKPSLARFRKSTRS